LWDAATGKVRAHLEGHTTRLTCIAFAPAAGLMATADNNGFVGIWEAGQQKPTRLFPAGHYASIGPFGLSFAPDGRTLASVSNIYAPVAGRPRPVRFWDVASAEERYSLEEPWPPYAISYSPDGRHFAVADEAYEPNEGRRCRVTLWDLGSRQVVERRSVNSIVRGLAFSPEGRTLAHIAGWSAVLWDLASYKVRARLRGHKDLVWSLAFSPDGRTLLTGSLDGTARLWDAASGKERAAFDWEIGKVYAVAFAPDGMRAAAGGQKNIVLWDIDEG
jgi:WD40 repeat protein